MPKIGRALGLFAVLSVTVSYPAMQARADEKKPLIISFNGPAGEAYVGKFIKGIKASAAAANYDIEIYENQFNQAEEDHGEDAQLLCGFGRSAGRTGERVGG